MNIEFDWRGTVSVVLRNSFEEGVRKSLNAFFKRYPEPISEIKLVAFRPATCMANGKLIRPASPTADFGQAPVGYRALITIEGSKTQGLVCLLTIDKKTVEEVTEIIEAGPYFKKRSTPKGDADAYDNIARSDDSEGKEVIGSDTATVNEVISPVVVEATPALVVSEEVASSPLTPVVDTTEVMSDVELIEYVTRILKQRKEVAGALASATDREQSLNSEIHDLQRQLTDKLAELATVSAQVEDFTARMSEFSISESLKQRALAAKARLDDSFGELYKS